MTINTKDMKSALGLLGSFVPRKPVIPILSGIHMSKLGSTLTMIANDLQSSVKTSVDIEGDQDYTLVIPYERFKQLVSTIDQQTFRLKVDVGANIVTILTASGNFKMQGHDADDYPSMSKFDAVKAASIENFGDSINNAIHAVGSDELRPFMTGLYMSKKGDDAHFVATDSYKLVVNDVVCQGDDFSINVPKSVASKLRGVSDVRLETDEEYARFKYELGGLPCEVTSHLIVEPFPDYNNFIPSEDRYKINKRIVREDLISAISRVMAFSDQNYKMRLHLEGQRLIIKTSDDDYGASAKEVIDAYGSEGELVIGLNASYLHSILSHLGSEYIDMNFVDERTQVTITSEGHKSILLPVVLNHY